MANIELRDYIVEIEQMLTAESNSEAVAHCRHILDYFPKNLAVYRLLGKGLLEQRQFDDAANVFYRVLSATPDDFVAHLGLAIIGEEEGNLGQSIGHMARAFETQPNNAAIQEELKRLYGRRDGVAPTRIRLTRGALARLYLNGGNYAQAAEELRVALKETPERIDLQILLAKALWYDEQRIDAVQVCQAVLQHLPYSLEANAILYEIWQSTDREEEAMLYRQRVEALDPLFALELGGRPTASPPKLEIPRLDYVPTAPDEIMGVPDWVKDLGLSFDEQDEGAALEAVASPFEAPAEDGSEAVPDWLRDMVPSGEDGESTESEREWAADKQLEEAVPSWLRDAGLLEDDEDEPVIEFDEPAEESPQTDEPLPSWLADAVEWENKKKEEPAQATDVPADDWLLELDAEETDHVSQVLAEVDGPAPPREGGTAGFGDLSWDDVEHQLEGSGEEQPAEPPEDLTAGDEFPFDWQDWELEEDSSSTESIAPEIEPERIEESAMPQSDKDEFRFPDEGDDLGEMPSDPEEAMKWLERLAASRGTPPEELSSLQGDEGLAPAEDMPEWLKEIAATSGYSPEGVDEQDEEEISDLPDWLGEDAHDPGAAQPSRPSASDMPDDDIDLPDWLKEDWEEGTAPSTAAQPSESLPRDSDEAMAWLEELALPSEEEEETPEAPEEHEIPDWLKEELVEEPGLETVGAAEASDEEMPEDIDEAMAWLESLAARQGAPLDELTTYKGEDLPEAELPDWLKAESEAPESPTEVVAQPQEEDELPDWLREQAEEPVGTTEVEETEPPGWLEEGVIPAADEKAPVTTADEEFELPEWLRETVGETVEAEEPPVLKEQAEEAEESGLPDWLREETLAEEPVVTAAEEPEEELELPEWLRQETSAEEEEVEEPEVVDAPVSEEEIALPEWLSEGIWEESVELAESEEIEPALVEEEGELPEWLRDESSEVPVEAAEAELVADIEEEELDLPEWLHEEAAEEVAVVEETEELLAEEVALPTEEPEVEIITTEEAPEPAAAEEEEQVAVEEIEMAPTEEVLAEVTEEPAEVEAPDEAVVAEEAIEEPAEEEVPVGIAAFQEQLAEEPDDHVTRLALARALVDDEVFEEALIRYDELISASQELDQVVGDLNEFLETQPGNTKARSLLGDAYMKQGDLARALETYRQALDLL
jgi:tetratricopeptide (TPR) repeat protein